jgi:hypothetical protein
MLKGREIIAYLAIKYHNKWEDIYEAIKEKELVEEEEVKKSIDELKGGFITIVDQDYPDEFKSIIKPPFAIFLLEEDRKIIGDTSSEQYLPVVGGKQNLIEPTTENTPEMSEFIVKMYSLDVLWEEFELLASSLEEAKEIIGSSYFEIKVTVPGAFYDAMLLDTNGKELHKIEQLSGSNESDAEMFLTTITFDVEEKDIRGNA